ncbi:GLRA2 [Branchiostoma lanceolatum]|uniref:GLRA2 protein n=1 Tax=Branchiostoma lanceolatum TaxID=7740 RepID=A0A8J9V792_BRALA|nr:GLRA2 [Branchiostoma lanceolatum]
MSRRSLFPLAVFFICLMRYCGGSLSDWETWQAFRKGDRLPSNYSKTVRPNSGERWTRVSCGVRLSDIGSLSETSMKFEARFDMTLEWTDSRLAGLTFGMAPIPIRYLWTPDIRFGQETEVLSESDSGDSMDDNTITTWIFPSGKIAFKKTYEGRIKCAMSLQAYPMDRQDCTFQIHGYNGVYLLLEPTFEWISSAPLTTDLPSVHSQFQIYSIQIRSFANSFLDTAEGKDCSYSETECGYQPWKCGLQQKDDEACQNYAGSCRHQAANCSLVAANATANTYTSLETLYFSRLLSSHLFELFNGLLKQQVCATKQCEDLNPQPSLEITLYFSGPLSSHLFELFILIHKYNWTKRHVNKNMMFSSSPPATANTYTSLEITLYFSRLLSSHLFELFIPCVTIVCLSWVAFWINPAAVPARVALGITTVLTMVTQATRVVGMPHVSYVRAIDVWVLACQAFVFLALIEYAVVNYLMNNANKAKVGQIYGEAKAKAKPAVSPTESLPRLQNNSTVPGKPAYHAEKVDNTQKDKPPSPAPTKLSKLSVFNLLNIKQEKPKNKEKNEGKKKPDKAAMIDETSRVLFPMAFLFFNIVYWLYYYDYF